MKRPSCVFRERIKDKAVTVMSFGMNSVGSFKLCLDNSPRRSRERKTKRCSECFLLVFGLDGIGKPKEEIWTAT